MCRRSVTGYINTNAKAPPVTLCKHNPTLVWQSPRPHWTEIRSKCVLFEVCVERRHSLTPKVKASLSTHVCCVFMHFTSEPGNTDVIKLYFVLHFIGQFVVFWTFFHLGMDNPFFFHLIFHAICGTFRTLSLHKYSKEHGWINGRRQ